MSRDYRALRIQTALQHQLKKAPSGLRAGEVADRMGKGYSTLMNEVSPDNETHKFAMVDYPEFSDLTGSVEALEDLCRQCGGIFVPVPTVDINSPEEMAAAADAIKEASEFCAATAESMRNGEFSRDEVERIQKEGHEAMQKITAVLMILHERRSGHAR